MGCSSVIARSPSGDEGIQSFLMGSSGLLRFRLRAPRFGGLIPAVARQASKGGSLAMTNWSTSLPAPLEHQDVHAFQHHFIALIVERDGETDDTAVGALRFDRDDG